MIFDKYEIVRRLAYGGMGEVFLARQRGAQSFDRLVILKSLRPELAQDDEVVEEFLEEARLAATLNHPNIVGVFEVGEWAGTYFIAMEYIRGEDVFRLCQAAIAQGRWVPPRVAVHIARDAALGLAAAHTATTPDGSTLHIVHRDVTPRNLMVRLDGVTKVVDFGVAKAADRAARTVTGGLKGTIAYMSPEQAFAGELDARSDQYSLGVILWELLAKQRLFGGKDSIEVLEAVRKADVRPPSAINDRVPLALDDLVMRMLQREREDRFPTCRMAADAMSQWLGEMAGPSGTERVSAFVTDVAGDAVEARTADLTPTGISLIPTERPVATELPQPAAPPTSARAAWTVAATGLALALGMAIALLVQEPAALPPLPAFDAGVPALASRPSTPSPAPSPAASAAAGDAGQPAVLAIGDGVAAPKGPEPANRDAGGASPSTTLGTAKDPSPSGASRQPGTVASAPPRTPGRSPTGRGTTAPSTTTDATAPTTTAPTTTDATGRPAGEGAGRPADGAQPGPATDATGAVAEPGAKAPAVVTLDTVPWTQVSVDGTARGATPVFRMELQPGRHIVHLVNPEAGIDEWRDLVVKAGQELHLDWALGTKTKP